MIVIDIESEKKKLEKRNKYLICSNILLLLSSIFFILYADIWVYLKFFGILFVCLSIILIGNLVEISFFNKVYSKLLQMNEIKELDKVIYYFRSRLILTDKYIIISKRMKVNVYKYSDIVMMYNKISNPRYLFQNIHRKTKLIFKNGDKRIVYGGNPYSQLVFIYGFKYFDLPKVIKEKNPNLLEYDTKKNQKILYEKYGIKL